MTKKFTLFLLAIICFINSSYGATQTINVNLTASSPTFTRPVSGNPPSSLSPQTGCYYSVFVFTAPLSGSYQFQAVGTLDNFGCLYQNSFVPSSPLTNILRSNDDWNPSDPLNKNYGFTRTLTAGVTYYLVSTMFYGATTGSYQVNITGPFTTALPVELSAFNGRLINDEVELTWTTSTEQNCSGFNVERSLDGKSFEKLSFVASNASNGNSNEELNYTFSDAKPAAVNYYRIGQVDLDGKVIYSQVIIIDVNNLNATVNTYPNPVSNELNVQFYTSKISKAEVTLHDMLGRVIVQSTTNTVVGNNIQKVDMSNCNTGMYILTTSINGKKLNASSIMKQ
ncbi:MAG: T9SS type A sorting domain-containing protein [Chitinophagaceae bacterium]|nr:T9SS type A sorting domain-containing protein [Chitinophagaceae bacterium]